MKLKPEQKLLAFIGGVALLTIIIVGAILVPTTNYIRQADKDTYQLRQYLEKKYERSRSARASSKEIGLIKDEIPKFDQYIFHAGDELQLITLLEDLATRDSVVQKIGTNNLDHITNQHAEISLTLTGSYKNVLTYLADLEKTPYFITITRLSWSAAADQTNPNKSFVSLSIDLSLYVQS